LNVKEEYGLGKRYSKALVTGGAGFIGSHLVDRLLREGFEVTVLDNLTSGNMQNMPSDCAEGDFRFVKGDIRDLSLVRETTKDIDVVFHQAAFVSVTLSVKNPLLANDVNVSGTLNLLKASLDSGVKRFVFASSAAVYGETPSPMKGEDLIPQPSSPYGVSKLAAEGYVRSFYTVYGLETVSLRYFNVYGPRQSFDIDCAYGGVITIFLNRLLRDMSPMIFGDGEQTRDFVYVGDVVESNILALGCKNAAGDFFNIGTNERISVNLVAKVLKHLLKKEDVKNVYADPRPGDIQHVYADTTKAKRILGYSPEFSLEEGLAELIKWHTTNSLSFGEGELKDWKALV
jgi:nucleoside-diphosphate-sugar epimerase